MQIRPPDTKEFKKPIKITHYYFKALTIYYIHQDGNFVCDLVRNNGVWFELFGGVTDRAYRFGSLIDRMLDYNTVVKL